MRKVTTNPPWLLSQGDQVGSFILTFKWISEAFRGHWGPSAAVS